MSKAIIISALDLLGRILEKVANDPTVQADPQLSKQLGDAMLLLVDLNQSCTKMMDEYSETQDRFYELTRPYYETGSGFVRQERYDKYQDMVSKYSPLDIYNEALKDGFDKVQGIKMLRTVLGMSLQEALDIAKV